MRFLYFFGGEIIGIVCLIYNMQIVKIFGRMGWAERYLGPAGTYLAWKLIGLVFIVAGFWSLRS